MSEDIDIQDLEEQDWDVGSGGQTVINHEFMNGHKMRFKLQDPDPDVIMEFVSPMPDDDDTTRSEELYAFVSEVIISPEVTIERWREMRTADKIMLADKVSEEVGVDRVLGFPDDGLEAQLEELLSESPESGDSG